MIRDFARALLIVLVFLFAQAVIADEDARELENISQQGVNHE